MRLPRDMSDALASVWRWAYWIPAQLLRESHWELTAEEAQLLGEGTDECLKTLPKRKRAAIAKVLSSYAPWAMLAGTLYTVTYPRMQITAIHKMGGVHEPPAGNGDRGSPSIQRTPRGASYAQTRAVRSWADYKPTGRIQPTEGD